MTEQALQEEALRQAKRAARREPSWTEEVPPADDASAQSGDALCSVRKLIRFLDHAPIPGWLARLFSQKAHDADPSQGRQVSALDVYRFAETIEKDLQAERSWNERTRLSLGHLLGESIFRDATEVYPGDEYGPFLSEEPSNVKVRAFNLSSGEPVGTLIDQAEGDRIYCALGVISSPEITEWFVAWRPVASILSDGYFFEGVTLDELCHMESATNGNS